MSLTSTEVINVLYQYIKNSVIFSDPKKPNGKLKKWKRPFNSSLEDVVINGLPQNYEPIQECVLNVNMFAPNLVIEDPETNTIDKSEPDSARLLYLSGLAKTAFNDGKEIWNDEGTYCFKLQQDYVEEDSNNQHYLNLRIEFYSLNI